MKIELIDIVNNTFTVREEMHEGRKHIVVPVVMMVEGVHAGSHGPMLYTQEELGDNVQSWNGMPVVINHPENDEGTYISANSPDVINREVVGRLYNAHMEGDKLKAEAWIDVARITAISPTAYQAILRNNAIDVSVGVFSEEQQIEGEWNGESYRAIATNLRPDHLAILPDSVGACSWDDGCGVRANQSDNKKKGERMAKPKLDSKEKHIAVFVDDVILNQENYVDVINKARQIVDSMDSEMSYHYLEALYDDHIVYRKYTRNSNNPERYYKQDYTINEGGDIVFDSDPVEVNKKVEYSAVTANKRFIIKRKIVDNKKEVSMTKCEKVAALISNESTKWAEEDKEFLNSLEEDQLEKMLPEEKKDPEPKTNKKQEEDEGKAEDKKIVFNSKDDFDKAVLSVFKGHDSPDDFIDSVMPDGDVKEQMKAGLSMYREKRKSLIKSIVSNSEFKEEELKSWEVGQLEKLAKSVGQETDYSGLGDYTVNEDGVVTNKIASAMLPYVRIKEDNNK